MTAPDTTTPSYDRTPVRVGTVVTDLDANWRLATALSQSQMLPPNLRGKPADVLLVCLWAAELGVSPVVALGGEIAIVEGRAQPSARLVAALLRRAGHRIEASGDAQSATVTVTRGDTGETVKVTWTLADAERAGLVKLVDGKPVARSRDNKPLPWELYTADMLYARALVRAGRRAAPEVMLGTGTQADDEPAGGDQPGPAAAPQPPPADSPVIVDAVLVDEPDQVDPDDTEADAIRDALLAAAGEVATDAQPGDAAR